MTKEKQLIHKIGLKESMVYKMKKGHRYPSFATMAKIEEVLSWSIKDQVESRKAGSYHVDFEKALVG